MISNVMDPSLMAANCLAVLQQNNLAGSGVVTFSSGNSCDMEVIFQLIFKWQAGLHKKPREEMFWIPDRCLALVCKAWCFLVVPLAITAHNNRVKLTAERRKKRAESMSAIVWTVRKR
jgi:hypothetical protein